MMCTTCGSDLEERVTDLPFKLGDRSIVIIKDVPVLQCPHCHAYLLRDPVMAEVERLLESANEGAELAILRYAA
ncbi:type II toxin-antitoxin system MqsA family antitoxin [Polyangium sp. 15x6]|uniref:type II toxin-antitoxin system MqsA family antitoxin n=1 Tax=Polyangium sp. 15x6 TaxID=3042687 RepID=UPI00249C85A5|nr:type II toxin-antitoxin system MqsA family antitoxin [Polyangium sp. 15x6]MDI3284390.1 type II toxin-antitoxin system MqsA family antitoxin [Polyangium sp. 15x6]